ncbi:MAG: hypothetical protein EP330_00800 [Deltaproteobacteria bacterium]|nr:MAG: hypothetical protein EP330_00800 [Deltaproteobacteria bacterium]
MADAATPKTSPALVVACLGTWGFPALAGVAVQAGLVSSVVAAPVALALVGMACAVCMATSERPAPDPRVDEPTWIDG